MTNWNLQNKSGNGRTWTEATVTWAASTNTWASLYAGMWERDTAIAGGSSMLAVSPLLVSLRNT